MERAHRLGRLEVVGQHKDLGIYQRPDGSGLRSFQPRPCSAANSLKTQRTCRTTSTSCARTAYHPRSTPWSTPPPAGTPDL
ncbi:MAG: hypothetical protein Q9Q13_01425 [Acidobacteriota bacterium]|nr:hypothetical protein [Acidobacteriota bacterium]